MLARVPGPARAGRFDAMKGFDPEVIGKGMAQLIRRHSDKVTAPLLRRIAELETQVKDLSERPGMDYQGVWREGLTFGRGVMVTHSGSLWYALAPTSDRPSNSADWQLAVKRGRAG